MYTLHSSTDNRVIAEVSNTEDDNIKKGCFKDNEASACENELNGESKIMDSTAETVELSTVTAQSAVQDMTSQEELNDTVSAHEDEEEYTQNILSQRYL